MKTFFGGIFIEASRLKEEGIQYPIKVEYYKLKDEDNKKYGIEIIPNGEAVQMARELETFNENLCDITRDGFHMSLDYGRYLTALVMYKYFTGKDTTLVEYEPCKTDHEICKKLKATH